MDLQKLAKKAQTSKIYLFLLNFFLSRFVPFNKAHRFKVVSIGDYHLHVKAPYRKSNFNHLKGVHACAQATIAEISSGLLLISLLNPKDYRLILQKLELEYLYQAKTDITAKFEIESEWLEEEVVAVLNKKDRLFIDCPIVLYDENDNKVAVANARWQIKNWASVKTKVT
jgi:acyl-coenzyme A thioesterase PaaI-like protein